MRHLGWQKGCICDVVKKLLSKHNKYCKDKTQACKNKNEMNRRTHKTLHLQKIESRKCKCAANTYMIITQKTEKFSRPIGGEITINTYGTRHRHQQATMSVDQIHYKSIKWMSVKRTEKRKGFVFLLVIFQVLFEHPTYVFTKGLVPSEMIVCSNYICVHCYQLFSKESCYWLVRKLLDYIIISFACWKILSFSYDRVI